jgi:hypothetical protein
MSYPDFPAWRHGPKGEARIFLSEDEVPNGWKAEVFPGFPKAMVARGPVANVLDGDGDGKAGGSTSAVADLKALRAEYKAKVGKKPYPAWNEAELRRRIAG